MKNKKILILSIITNIILLGLICSFININKDIIREKQVVKEMSENNQVMDLNNQINSLNTEHTEYMNYIQTCKTAIATALTNEGVPTSNQATLETMAENISKVLQVRTSDATATINDILAGKTAYVNGEKIIGTKVNNISNLKLVEVGSKISDATGNDESWSFNPTKTDVYLIVQTASGGNTSCYINNISGNINVLWQEYHVRNNYDGYAIRITLAQLTANNPITMVARAGGNCRYIYRKVYSLSL